MNALQSYEKCMCGHSQKLAQFAPRSALIEHVVRHGTWRGSSLTCPTATWKQRSSTLSATARTALRSRFFDVVDSKMYRTCGLQCRSCWAFNRKQQRAPLWTPRTGGDDTEHHRELTSLKCLRSSLTWTGKQTAPQVVAPLYCVSELLGSKRSRQTPKMGCDK